MRLLPFLRFFLFVTLSLLSRRSSLFNSYTSLAPHTHPILTSNIKPEVKHNAIRVTQTDLLMYTHTGNPRSNRLGASDPRRGIRKPAIMALVPRQADVHHLPTSYHPDHRIIIIITTTTTTLFGHSRTSRRPIPNDRRRQPLFISL